MAIYWSQPFKLMCRATGWVHPASCSLACRFELINLYLYTSAGGQEGLFMNEILGAFCPRLIASNPILWRTNGSMVGKMNLSHTASMGKKNSEAAFILLDGHCPVQLCSGSRLCDAGQAAVRKDDTCIHPREQLQLPVPWLLVPAASDFLLLCLLEGGGAQINKMLRQRSLQQGHFSGKTLMAPITSNKRPLETERRPVRCRPVHPLW